MEILKATKDILRLMLSDILIICIGGIARKISLHHGLRINYHAGGKATPQSPSHFCLYFYFYLYFHFIPAWLTCHFKEVLAVKMTERHITGTVRRRWHDQLACRVAGTQAPNCLSFRQTAMARIFQASFSSSQNLEPR